MGCYFCDLLRRDSDCSKIKGRPMAELSKAPRSLHVGILGGGITGLTAAFYLLRAGHRVTVLEGRAQVGGLATYFDFGPFHWDKFYHCILTSDLPLLQLIDDLGLTSEIRWTETKVGFYTGKGFHSMTTTMDFLRFPDLSLWEKFRLGLGVLRASRIKDGKKLEAIPIADWLIRIFGRGNYEKMWEPLLKCKLGSCREEASAAFIWATIFRLYSTREKGASQKERMGCVVLILRRKLTPYYVTNLTDNDVPFTGVIEMTNLISKEETAGRHLVYLPKYTAPGDPLFETSDDDVWSLFQKAFKRMFPDLVEDEIERRFVFREKLVQPLPVLRYSERVPSMRTNIPGIFLANTTQIINSTLNNNEMVKIARRIVEMLLSESGPNPPEIRSPVGSERLSVTG